MRFRKLLLAWSVFWGVAGVLLIVLWVRSYSSPGMVFRPIFSQRVIVFSSYKGQAIVFIAANYATRTQPDGKRVPVRFSGWNFSPGRATSDSPKSDFSFDYSRIDVPHWFVVLVTGMVAAAPWVHWSQQFSLCTLLIGTTLVAVVLGLAVYAASK